MARAKQSKGKCVFCQKEMTKAGLTRHFSSCAKRQQAIDAANSAKGIKQTLYHLQVRAAHSPAFWLHLEMDGIVTLQVLDGYLRAIWLECCGHLSQLSIGGWRGDEIPLDEQADKVFKTGLELTHLYDFGTTSETLIKVVGTRQGHALSEYPIFLMARNNPLEELCIECGKPASWLCIECVYEMQGPGTLCSKHAEKHPHDDYGEPMPLVNSPRLGMCGYDGPAEAPY